MKFELGSEGVEVKLGSLTLRRIRYDDIESVSDGPAFWNEHWVNFYPFEYITIRRKSGLIRNFVINPKDKETFVSGLRQRLVGRR